MVDGEHDSKQWLLRCLLTLQRVPNRRPRHLVQEGDNALHGRILRPDPPGASGGVGHEYTGQKLICVASAYASHFDQLRIKARKGRWYIVTVSFSASPYNDVGGGDWVRSDNIIGDPASLSDSSITSNQRIKMRSVSCLTRSSQQPTTTRTTRR